MERKTDESVRRKTGGQSKFETYHFVWKNQSLAFFIQQR